MPIYEYTCEKCEKSFDKLVRSMTADTTATCPACGAEAPRALSVFAVGGEATGSRSSATLPMGGGCCPCGKNANQCGG